MAVAVALTSLSFLATPATSKTLSPKTNALTGKSEEIHWRLASGVASAASAHSCGLVSGAEVRTYNLSCRRARAIFGGQPPEGWTAGNVDVAGGVVFYCHASDEETVTKAIDPHTGRVHARRLHGAPLVIAAEPYGDSRRPLPQAPPRNRAMRSFDGRPGSAEARRKRNPPTRAVATSRPSSKTPEYGPESFRAGESVEGKSEAEAMVTCDYFVLSTDGYPASVQ